MDDPEQLLAQAIGELRQSRMDDAAEHLDAVLALVPDHPLANSFRATVHLSQGNAAAALPLFRKAAAAHAQDLAFQQNFAIALLKQDAVEEAEAHARQALALNPQSAPAAGTLAQSLRRQGRDADALPLLQQLVAAQPTAAALNDLGLCLMDLNHPDQAEAAFLRATEADPDIPAPWHNLGNALLDQQRPDEAVSAYDRALAADPNDIPSAVHKGQALLLAGKFREGWDAYEARWRLAAKLTLRDGLTTPLWDGSPLNGRRLLVYAEQGMGDAIQFARFLSMAADQGGTVIADLPPALYRLFAAQDGGYDVSRQDQPPPSHDLRLPMMSLARVLGIGFDDLPGPSPYLAAVDGPEWDRRLPERSGIRIGLAWRALAEKRGSARRSVPLTDLAPLFARSGLSWISLQKEFAPQDHPLPDGLMDVSDGLGDFADTAALITRLDLVLTVDTAVAHLAGALGKQVWVMLPRGNDWRWLTGRADSPWYPTARLYRQDEARSWTSVVEALARDLAEFAA